MPTTYKKIFVDVPEEELAKMTREEASLNLNDKQRKWCETYVNNFNCKIAAKKAGYSVHSAATIGWKLKTTRPKGETWVEMLRRVEHTYI